MCFAVPYKVINTGNNSALIEGGVTVRLGKDIEVAPGEYLQVVGNVAVGKLSQKDGLKIRKLIKRLNS